MATTQFAMVEELASLIKDNLHSKHLVLSIEEALINFLEDTSSDGILELQPMSPYHRLLLHRLADIYGFAHESVGEGDDRHLILERSSDTTIPPILVSDILWQYDEEQSLNTSKFIIRRNEVPALAVLKTIHQLSPSTPFEEREASYKAARERIFSLHDGDEQDGNVPKSRKIPVVARRMIAHALGQRISTPSIENLSLDVNENEITNELRINEGKGLCSNMEDTKESTAITAGKLCMNEKKRHTKTSSSGRKSDGYSKEYIGDSLKNNLSPNASNRRVIVVEDLKKQQTGAARRIFANALGLSPGKGNQEVRMKPSDGNRDISS
ncbi:R3H domain-containing protein 2 isoform X1 [Canna indica]|uniref:R3H domain-containing protein 2 isoform X1 n=1 Tax=Canna indica TaxID=4628 RepID=A0AAQ3KTH7_9LILI|nr:R3H domain-containing protein 2 isoform X1 [Canna indica]